MCVFEEEVKMSVHMHVNDDGSIMYDVMMKIFEIALSVAKLSDPLQQLFLFSEVKLLTFVVHVEHSLILERRTTIECQVLRMVIELQTSLTLLIMIFILIRFQLCIAESA